MPDKKDLLTQCYCGPCSRKAKTEVRTWHVRYVDWHKDDYGFWKETLCCRECGNKRDRYALPIEQDRLNKAYPGQDVVPVEKPEPDMSDIPLFAAMGG